MNRQEEINKMAKEIASYITSDKDMQVAFADALIRGAEWADAHPHWISVEDELPKEYANLLVAISNHFCYTAFCCGDKWYSNDNLYQRELSHVTHWMPLPKPPMKGDQQ